MGPRQPRYFICRRLFKLGRTEDVGFHEEDVRRWYPCGLISLGVAVFVGELGIIEAYPLYYASFVAMFHERVRQAPGSGFLERGPGVST